MCSAAICSLQQGYYLTISVSLLSQVWLSVCSLFTISRISSLVSSVFAPVVPRPRSCRYLFVKQVLPQCIERTAAMTLTPIHISEQHALTHNLGNWSLVIDAIFLAHWLRFLITADCTHLVLRKAPNDEGR